MALEPNDEISGWTKARLLEEWEQLRLQLDEAEQTLQAIRCGDVDALVISGPQGEQVFSLAGAERMYRVVVETMNEAALTVSVPGTILFCNRRFCELMRIPQETVVGKDVFSFVALQHQMQVKDLISTAEARPIRRLTLRASDGTAVPVQLCASVLESAEGQSICLVASDLSELEASNQSVGVLRDQQQALEHAQVQLTSSNIQLQKTNVDQRAARLAALNLMEDALEARKQAEHVAASLRKSEEQYRTIVSQVTTGVAETDRTGLFILVNQRYCDITGYTRDELLRMRMQDITHPEDLPRSVKQFGELVAGGPDFVIEKRYHRKDGTVIWVNNSVAAVRDPDGRPQSIVAVVLDITERKRQEQELMRRTFQQSRLYEFADAVNRMRALSTLYEKALDTITSTLRADRASILLFDEDGVMRFKAWSELSEGYRRAVEGHSPWERDTPDPRAFSVGAIEDSGISHSLQSVIQQEGIEALGFVPLLYGGRLLGKVMLYFNRPYTMTHEEIDLAQAIASTLALGIARTTADVRLRESEERLRSAMTAGEMGAWDIDLETGTVTWDAKQYELYGRRRPPANIDEFYELVHADDVERVQQAAAQAEENGRFAHEFRIVRPEGDVRWIAGHGAIVTDQRGCAVRMVGVNYDVTARKEAQARAERFAEELEQQVANRTEELEHSQEQLRALASELNLAEQRERKRLATELHDHLQQMLVLGKLKLGQGKRLAQAIPACADIIKQTDDVLTEALQYTRTLVAELSPPILREHGLPAGLKWLAEYMKRHDITVTVRVSEFDGMKLPEDQVVLLFQSVRELLINSSKHAQSHEATVTLERAGAGLRVEVKDHGVGFNLAAAGATVPTALSSKFGLFSIRERMRALGGWLDIDSAPGQGTTATLTLPLVVKPPGEVSSGQWGVVSGEGEVASDEWRVTSDKQSGRSVSERSPLTTRHSPLQQNAKIRVLLVDDHAMVRQGLRTVLDSYPDLEVVGEAWDGREAVAYVDRLNPNVVVMDINMPKMNGIEATTQIVSRRPDIVVIGLSVNAGGDNTEAMKKAGAAMLITKEAAVDELYRAIQDVLSIGKR